MVLHFLTESLLPAKGGLEIWTFQHALRLSQEGYKVVVHVFGPSMEQKKPESFEKHSIAIKYVSLQKRMLEEPLAASENAAEHLRREHSRNLFLLLRNSVENEIRNFPQEKHVIISNFLLWSGFLAALVAENLSLPHIACVVGTDFSRGFYQPREREVIRTVLNQASVVVAWNHQQMRALKNAFNPTNLVTIHTTINSEILNFKYKGTEYKNGKIRLFSDCGFSFKKGTHLLMRAYDQLCSQGLSVELTICGDISPPEADYWNKLISYYQDKYPQSVNFMKYVTPPELWERMVEHDIYCSATLGEGCSLARVAALCTGMPIVTTLCGEMADLSLSHIRTSLPGDENGFMELLLQTCMDFLNGDIIIQEGPLEEWKQYFTSAREINAWKGLLNQITA